jgi:hypothetical protein
LREERRGERGGKGREEKRVRRREEKRREGQKGRRGWGEEKRREGQRGKERRGKWGGEERGEVHRGDGARRRDETRGGKRGFYGRVDPRENSYEYLYWKESSAARVFLRTRTPSLLPAWTPLNCTAYVTVLPFGTNREGAPENPTPRGVIKVNGEI